VPEQDADRGFAGELRCFLSILFYAGDVDMWNEVIRIGAPEDEHPHGSVAFRLLDQRDKVADQIGPEKIHGRRGYPYEQNGGVLLHAQRRETRGHANLLVEVTTES
jgi:hypothetical protein